MASTTAPPVSGVAPTSTAAQPAVQAVGSPAFSAVASSDGFLKPGSPRKRRRSIDRTQSPAKNLEGQVKEKLEISPSTPSVELTGAAEMAEQKRRKTEHNTEHLQQGIGRQQSANPRHQTLSALRGGTTKAMSKPSDAPRATGQGSAMGNLPEINTSSSTQVSPTSNTSSNPALDPNVGTPQVASPTQMTEHEGAPEGGDVPMTSVPTSLQTASPKSYSYPDPGLIAAQISTPSRRDMSLPGGSTSEDTKPGGAGKKHKCPYCDTEFTRHHNLKSHLLTHSQEKPYLCRECDMRFRRLHDLKRHTKLHTGERPHVCPICNRKFARGDALARHTKGAGGCAGHRSSVGSFTNEAANEGEMVMENIMYTGETSQEPGEMEEGEGPSRRQAARHTQYQNSVQSSQSRQPSTYPPVASRSQYLQTPGQHANSSSSATVAGAGAASPAASHAPYGHSVHQNSYPSSNSFPHNGMTESPAPISPSTNQHSGNHDPRRSSAGQQLHSYPRSGVQGNTSPQTSGGGSGPAPMANMVLQPPQAIPSSTSGGNAPGGHFAQLQPPLPPISTDARAGTSTAGGHGHVAAYASGPGSASTHNSLSSHGQSSGERGGLGIDERDRLWAIIKTLESQVSQLRERQDNMEREIVTLKRAADEKQPA